MSYSFDKIRRKSDGKILDMLTNDSCDSKWIFDGDVLVDEGKNFEIGCYYGKWVDESDYESVDLSHNDYNGIEELNHLKELMNNL